MKKLTETTALLASLFLACSSAPKATAANTVRLEIAVPGVAEKIIGQAAADGTVTIESYPATFRGQIALKAMASATFGRTLSDAVCQAVGDRAALAADTSFPADLRQLAKANVRTDNSFTLDLKVVSFLATGEFSQAVKAAAVAAGLHAPAYLVVNPLAARSLDVSLELADDALSKKIGSSDVLVGQVKRLLGEAGVLTSGEGSGEISAADLVCDLRSGAAKVVVGVTGQIAGPSDDEPLFDTRVAEILYRDMKARLAETPAEFTSAQRLIAGGEAMTKAAAEAGAELNWKTIGVIGAKLFDARSGALVDVSLSDLPHLLSVPSDGGEPYQGQSTLVMH